MEKKLPLILTVVTSSTIIIAVLLLMSYVQKLLYSDVRINLTEIVTQNKDLITSKIMVAVNNLENMSIQITDRLVQEQALDNACLKKVIAAYSAERGDARIFISNGEGEAFFGDGTEVRIAGRRYFKLAMEGKQNISERVISRQSGEDIFVTSVPLYFEGEIAGTLQRAYSQEEMYALCSVSLFSSRGNMHIINSEGYVLLSSQSTEYSRESDNYFRSVYAQGNQEEAKRLEEDVRNNRAGFMEIVMDGEKVFSAYTPIEDLHDWHLISSVANDAVSPNANVIIKLFYLILLAVALIFGIILFSFLTNKNRQRAKLEHIAFVDEITQGNTYSKFVVELSRSLQEHPEKKHYILALDIDNFKYVNSYYGFDVGDKILRRVYLNISANLMLGETVARISGDHFVALLEDASEERLRGLVNLTFQEEGVTVYASAGLYAVTDPDESINLMVDKASTAADSAKDLLVKRVETYSEQFDQVVGRNEQLKRELDQALAGREIIPFYQPKVDVHTGKLVGAEALARWRTADGRMVSPGEFIPLCEKTGKIVEMDMLIFEQVLEFLKESIRQGICCKPISVNFSRLHLMNKEFIHAITARLEAHGIPPHLIEIELTESVIFDNHAIIRDFTDHLHDHGLLISIDDFGSGYSSLNVLKDIPIDILKIDKEFLDETAYQERQKTILSAIVSMAEKLGIGVVVEGVETLENVMLMKELGCSVAQGYYFAKPMSEDAFRKIFKEGTVC